MYFAQYGSGEKAIVGLHGWSGDHRTFSPLVPYLPQGVTLYSADLPGTGKSPTPQAWTINQLASDIATGILSLPASQLTLLGSCSGGLFGLFVAKHLLKTGRAGALVRLVLIDPFAYFPWYFKVFIAPQMGKIGWYAYYTTFANPIGRWVTNLSLVKHRTEQSSLTESFAATNHHVTYRYLQLLAEGGTSNQFREVTIPVAIVYGENTFGAVRESLRIWKQVLPDVTCHELKDAAHLPIEEAPAELARVLFQANDSKEKL